MFYATRTCVFGRGVLVNYNTLPNVLDRCVPFFYKKLTLCFWWRCSIPLQQLTLRSPVGRRIPSRYKSLPCVFVCVCVCVFAKVFYSTTTAYLTKCYWQRNSIPLQKLTMCSGQKCSIPLQQLTMCFWQRSSTPSQQLTLCFGMSCSTQIQHITIHSGELFSSNTTDYNWFWRELFDFNIMAYLQFWTEVVQLHYKRLPCVLGRE